VIETEVESSYTDWKTTSSKPSKKDGREIKTFIDKVAKKVCEDVVTVEWREVSLSEYQESGQKGKCQVIGLLKYECEYEVKETKCETKYTNVTKYKYRDLVETETKVTYYKFRTVSKGEPLYTGYILESEMPEGYTKLPGSETTQYRYRENCGK